MKKYTSILLLYFITILPQLFAADFTISSYNCGALPDHYDYIRTACMQKIMQERYTAEPQMMAQIEKIQQIALQALFGDSNSQAELNASQPFITLMTSSPLQSDSPNYKWMQLSNDMVSTYKERPINLRDVEVKQMLETHLQDLVPNQDPNSSLTDLLTTARNIMAARIFQHHLKHDIICLQEADYLESSLFPEHYETAFSNSAHSINAIVWNKNRFDLLERIDNTVSRAFIVKLWDKENQKSILVASAHITGCNPFQTVIDKETNVLDSEKGDNELKEIFTFFENTPADLKIIGMDSNVTGMHPRLKILKEFNYMLDYENFLEPTCTNPYQILNTRLDWIAAKSQLPIKIVNIPIFSVGLNSIQTNISDHKPIAARISFE